jgi:hypothetical protein
MVIKERYEERSLGLRHDMCWVGYMWCFAQTNKHPLSPKKVWENIEEIVLKDNRIQFNQLYELELKQR